MNSQESAFKIFQNRPHYERDVTNEKIICRRLGWRDLFEVWMILLFKNLMTARDLCCLFY